MSSDVVLSAALRSNLLSLQSTQRSIDNTQLRLATGLKVNSALDNPQSFFTSQTLNNRASDLKRLLDGISLSVRTIQETDKGVTALTTLVSSAQSIAQSALSAQQNANGFATITSTKDLSGVNDLVDPALPITTTTNNFQIVVKRASVATPLTSGNIAVTDATSIDAVAANINANATINTYVKAAVSNGKLVITSKEEGAQVRITNGASNSLTASGFAYLGLDGYVGTENTVATTRNGGTVVAGTRTITSKLSTGTAVNGKYSASDSLLTAGYVNNYTTATTDATFLSLTIDGVTTQISPSTGYINTTTVQQVVDNINSAGLSVTAAFDTTTGKIGLTFGSGVGTAKIAFTAGSAGVGDVSFGFGTGASDATTTAAANVNSEQFVFTSGSADVTSLANDYNKVRTQIDSLVKDANFRGINLLGGDTLTTNFNEDRTSKLDTVGVDFSATGLGITSAAFTTTTSINTSLTQLDAALTKVRNFGSSIANDLAIIQTRQDFTSSTIDTLKAGASDLTAADQNEEGANLLALQTRQQLGVTALSLAAQSQQSVLRLF